MGCVVDGVVTLGIYLCLSKVEFMGRTGAAHPRRWLGAAYLVTSTGSYVREPPQVCLIGYDRNL